MGKGREGEKDPIWNVSTYTFERQTIIPHKLVKASSLHGLFERRASATCSQRAALSGHDVRACAHADSAHVLVVSNSRRWVSMHTMLRRVGPLNPLKLKPASAVSFRWWL